MFWMIKIIVKVELLKYFTFFNFLLLKLFAFFLLYDRMLIEDRSVCCLSFIDYVGGKKKWKEKEVQK